LHISRDAPWGLGKHVRELARGEPEALGLSISGRFVAYENDPETWLPATVRFVDVVRFGDATPGGLFSGTDEQFERWLQRQMEGGL